MLSFPELDEGALRSLVAVLRAGGVVACATETFFGLLADAHNADAVERVCVLKGRDPNSPLALLLPHAAALGAISDEEPDSRVQRLAERYWPGPLTLLVRARPGLPSALVKEGKVGVRVPGHSPALQLTSAFGAPLTATSANLSGQPAARTAAEVLRAIPSGLEAVVGTHAPGGLASTIIDTTGPSLVVLRQGSSVVPLADFLRH